MDFDAPIRPWCPAVRVPSTVAHVVGILATVCRLLYRWRFSKFWWEDTWAALALISDITCLASIWMSTPPKNAHTKSWDRNAGWLLSMTITSVLWFARMSIWCSIVRMTTPTPKSRLIAYGIGTLFLVMLAGLLAQKIFTCVESFCWMTRPVAIAQLVTDIISDTILVVAPVLFLRNVKLSRDRRILILSVFSASILITGITILHSIFLFDEASNITMMIGHLKAAFALFLCNALVLVTFIYRLCRKSVFDVEHSAAEGHSQGDAVEFTTIIDLPSKSSSRGHGVQSGGDATHSKPLPLDTSTGLKQDPFPLEK